MTPPASSSSSSSSSSPTRPQPHDGGDPYTYLHAEKIASRFFRDDDFSKENQLVWVCTSKGRRGRRQIQVNDNETTTTQEESIESTKDKETGQQRLLEQRLELFLPARVVQAVVENSNRIRVRYPKGSTYCVKRSHLLPVLEHQSRLVLVAAETPLYRRCCVTQTLANETFVEIGSDLGCTVQRVYETGDENRCVVGIDKSEFSIKTSRERYPQRTFVQWDFLDRHQAQVVPPVPVEVPSSPEVVAIDINGNRELKAVLECLDVVFNRHHWEPRLIIVKSRTLHALLEEEEEESD